MKFAVAFRLFGSETTYRKTWGKDLYRCIDSRSVVSKILKISRSVSKRDFFIILLCSNGTYLNFSNPLVIGKDHSGGCHKSLG